MKRVLQYCDNCGFTIFFIFYIVDMIITLTGGSVSWNVRLVMGSLHLLFTLCSCIPAMMYGDGSLDPLKETTGDYGVGCKETFTPTNGQFIAVYYPVDKVKYTAAMKDNTNKVPYVHWS